MVLLAAGLGFAAGFIGSMPLAGPVAVIVLDRAFRGERRGALFIALGAALAEAVHAMIVGLTLPVLLGRWPSVLVYARGAGAVLLLIVGAVLAAKPRIVSATGAKQQRGNFVTGLAAAGLNPTLLASWTAVISAFYGEGLLEVRTSSAVPFAIGVAIGVVAWMAIVVFFAHQLRRRMNEQRRRHMVRGFGVLLVGLGLYLGGRLIFEPAASANVPADVPGL